MKIGISSFISTAALTALTGCNGIMDGIYDDDIPRSGNVITVDASNWKNWYYIDLHALTNQSSAGQEQTFEPYAIPTTLTDEWDGESKICTYWYDVFGEGLQHNEFRGSINVDAQPEPEHWDIALHRDNVRTNGGEVWQTTTQDITSPSLTAPLAGTGEADTWNETDVWMDQSQMFTGVIGNQRIKTNRLLSSWLSIQIPPIPPSFTYNGNVFIVRLKDGTYAALRLADYRSKGTNCIMTIEYRYPLN